MKCSVAILALVSLAAAGPAGTRQVPDRRQIGGVGAIANEFDRGGCNDVIFMWARGSTEIGNMGTIVGPPTADALKAEFGRDKVAVQGITYAAALSTNFLPGGADPIGVNDMTRQLEKAAADCPDSVIVAGGYSQGAAVCHRSIEALDSDVQNRIAGVIMYGDTQNRADGGKINNFPADKVKIICASPVPDQVCENGVLTAAVLPPHLSYGGDAQEGADFLIQKVQGAQGGAGQSGGARGGATRGGAGRGGASRAGV